MSEPPQLLFSALTWDGEPALYETGYDSKPLGTYAEGAPVSLFNIVGWNVEHDAIEYTPAAPTLFTYTRRTYIDDDLAASADVVVQGDCMPPLLRVCLPTRNPWPEVFKPESWTNRPLSGPPFHFYDTDWDNLNPEDMEGHRMTDLDLPGQDNSGPYSDMNEDGGWKMSGWQGTWVDALLEKQARGEDLGHRTKIVWHKNLKHGQKWAVKVKLHAIEVFEIIGEPGEPTAIHGYKVEANILAIFVKPEEIERLQS
ncbi:hypothetical protein C8J57DRAFT_61365 [Mycena rebaudengoi]|nr:hypothetical protein C8J57DRAFT_61365 [Mycena rebaudengoi]